jgi:uncharacterized oligopeptide transporter (OPT) family protein
MAILHLSDDQIASMTRAEKDKWWFENVYRGDMAQLTLRSALTGFLLGGILSATALYVGAKTGITIGVGLTAVILSFAMFRILASLGWANDFTILENNCTQSIATAAGYMISPMISSLAAYMLITGKIIPWWQMMIWCIVVSILGVLVAFPMKRRFINEDQAPFPEGRAAGVVLDSLYTGDAATGMYKAKLLGFSALLSAFYSFITGDGWMRLLQIKILAMEKWAGIKEAWVLPDKIDDYYYEAATRLHLAIPHIMGTDIRQLGLRLSLELSTAGIGGLMGMRIATSCLLGAFINFVILAPLMIQKGDIAPRISAAGKLIPISRSEIVNQWSLWWAVTMMVVGSLVGLLAKPELFKGIFRGLGKKKEQDSGPDLLKDIEVPLWISYIGVPIMSVVGAWVCKEFFDVPWKFALISFPLIFVLTIIATNAMALTSWTPTGALSKITQFTMGALDRANPATNLIPAGMTGEIAGNASNLLSDIKPGYMLGGKPRHQVVGHVIGIFAGAMASIPLFFLLFLQPDANGVVSASGMLDKFPLPAALQWKGVAELIAKGFGSLKDSAQISMMVAAVTALAFEVARVITKGRFPISAVSVGLGVVLPPDTTITMWLGALVFWIMGMKKKEGTPGHKFWVDGCEPICAGLISGGALMGIGNAIINALG